MEPIVPAKGLVKRYGRVVALDHCDFELYPSKILSVIGDNGVGRSSLISHKMPHVFEVCDRIHIQRLGKRLTVIDSKDFEMSDVMTGAKRPERAAA